MCLRASQTSIFNRSDHVEQRSLPELPGLALARLYIKPLTNDVSKRPISDPVVRDAYKYAPTVSAPPKGILLTVFTYVALESLLTQLLRTETVVSVIHDHSP